MGLLPEENIKWFRHQVCAAALEVMDPVSTHLPIPKQPQSSYEVINNGENSRNPGLRHSIPRAVRRTFQRHGLKQVKLISDAL